MKNRAARRATAWTPAALAVLALVSAAACSRPGRSPLPPEKALQSLRLSDSFRVELFASEPMVLDPVDMVFDERGRAYVADMLDLPWDPPPGKPARSRIVLLEDTDGDGRADKSTVFAENVLQVSGLMVWKGGLIVPAAPNIYYMKDTDGDGRADVREVLFSGFFTGNPEAQITNPRLALDNWIYFSNTGNAGRITSAQHPNRPPIEVRGADFRYHPVRGIAEPASGAAQYGSTFDDWGNRFISQNTQHLRHVVIPRHYLARAPLLEVQAVNHDPYGQRERRMWPLTAPQQWRVKRTQMRQQRYDENRSGRKEHATGYLSGATGGTVYNGDAWPAEYRGNIFTGDVSGNLVRRDIVEADGVTFTARPAREGVEFLASTDQWFRPTSFANAPDGQLYLMDMYREIIETPLSIPEELKKGLDFYSGDRHGRIYRLAPGKPRHQRKLAVRLDTASTAELAALLGHENGWHRQTAQRLLIERQPADAAAPLQKLAAADSPLTRLHVLWTLEGLGRLTEANVLAALRDSDGRIREHAIRLAGSLPRSQALERALTAMTSDTAARVRLQLAFTLGSFPTPAAQRALVQLAAGADAASPWMRTAILSSVSTWPAGFYRALPATVPAELTGALGSLIGARNREPEIASFLEGLLARGGPSGVATPVAHGAASDAASAASPAGSVGGPQGPRTGLQGLARGLSLANASGLRSGTGEAALLRLTAHGDDEVARAAWAVGARFQSAGLQESAAKQASDGGLTPGRRAAATAALRDPAAAGKILDSIPPAPVQAAAVDALSNFGGTGAAEAILSRWKLYAPEARSRAIAALVNRAGRAAALLDAIERNRIEAALIDTGARNRLAENTDPAVAGRARKLFAAASGDRGKVVAAYLDVARMDGNVDRGRQHFEDACAKCHSPRSQGGRVGPDLSGISNKTREELLEAILNPSAAIEPRFVNYLVTTKDGRTYDGVLAGETPGAITLRGGSEQDVTILRDQIRQVRASSISLMPEDLESGLSKQGIADLIAYLRGGL